MITEKDIRNLESDGRSLELIKRQLEYLINGTSTLTSIFPATSQEGIRQLSIDEEQEARNKFNSQDGSKQWTKFVPASGAASRMFAPFFSYLEKRSSENFDRTSFFQSEEGKEIKKVFDHLKKLPFFGTVMAEITPEDSPKLNIEKDFFDTFVDVVVQKEQLNYPSLPKALIPFFVDDLGQEWTAFEAQLLEALQLGGQNLPIHLHFTIDKEYKSLFQSKEEQFRTLLSSAQSEQLQIQYSFQNRLTDTPYIDQTNQWCRNPSGKIAFRKGGHGALLENLNHLDADCVWIKNIDNIQLSKDNAKGEEWLKIIGGKLLSIQEKLFKHLHTLDTQNSIVDFEPILDFIRQNFDPSFVFNPSDKMPHAALFDYLNRPLRICGMIPNEGAKGGGPFWKKTARGKSLQIIEGVELDPTNKVHKKAIENSTHFNPVMMVCGITNFKGEKFSLYDFRDEQRFMVSDKTLGATAIKILEWPGLWNGSMAEWNTLFVELPPKTFNPVKTVIDLIR
ncbi:MAG: DUF4301 family protein [Flavobacteriaceae bacterium]